MGGRENPEPLKNFPLLSLGNAVSDHSGKKKQEKKNRLYDQESFVFKNKRDSTKKQTKGKTQDARYKLSFSPQGLLGFYRSQTVKTSVVKGGKKTKGSKSQGVRCVILRQCEQHNVFFLFVCHSFCKDLMELGGSNYLGDLLGILGALFDYFHFLIDVR